MQVSSQPPEYSRGSHRDCLTVFFPPNSCFYSFDLPGHEVYGVLAYFSSQCKIFITLKKRCYPEVTFDIDANGIVHVSAKDLATQKEQSIKITASSGLSKEEVEKLVRDAQSHTEEDKKRRKLAEAKNQADNLVYQTEKNLTEYGDKVDPDEKTKIQDAVAAVKKALEGTDADAIESATQTLMTASHKLAEEMYKKAAASATPGAGADGTTANAGGETKTDEKVVDAEFEEVDKEKK